MKNQLLLCFFVIFYGTCSWKGLAIPNNLETYTYLQLDSVIAHYFYQEEINEGIAVAAFGREKARKEFGEMDTLYAIYCQNLGYFKKAQGKYQVAELLYKEALQIQKAKLGSKHKEYATCLNSLALLYNEMGKYELAEKFGKENLIASAQSFGKSHPQYASSLNNLSLIYSKLGLYQNAEKLYLEAIRLYKSLSLINKVDFASMLSNLANLYNKMGRYHEAELLYIDALNITKSQIGEHSFSYAKTSNNLALMYKKLGRYEESKSIFEQSKKVRIELLGRDHPAYADILNNMAMLYESMEIFDQAELNYKASLNIYKNLFKEQDHPKSITPLHNLALMYHRQGQFQLAEKLYYQVVERLTQKYLENHPRMIDEWNNLAKLYVDSKQYKKAWECLDKAYYAICNDTLTKLLDRPVFKIKFENLNSYIQTKIILKTLSITYQLIENESNTNTKLQLQIAQSAIELLHFTKNKYIDEQDKLHLINQSYEWLFRGLKILYASHELERAFDHIERHKAILLLESAQQNNAFQLTNIPDSLAFKEKNLTYKKQELEAMLVEFLEVSKKDSIRNQINEVNFELNALQKRLI